MSAPLGGYSADKPPAAPLPDGWTMNSDPASGQIFYNKAATGETTWDRPAAEAPPVVLPSHFPLPEGWSEHTDPSTGNVFYACAATAQTTWVRPVPAPPSTVAGGGLSADLMAEIPPGLPGAFLGYLKLHPEVLDSIRNYQAQHRHLFVNTEEEYPLEAKTSYDAFVGLIDQHLTDFLNQNGATSEMFADALLDLKTTNNPHWMAFDLLLRKVDFPTLAGLMRSNTCLCCGGVFMGTTA